MPFLFWKQDTEEASRPGSSVVGKRKGRGFAESEGQGAGRGEREGERLRTRQEGQAVLRSRGREDGAPSRGVRVQPRLQNGTWNLSGTGLERRKGP